MFSVVRSFWHVNNCCATYRQQVKRGLAHFLNDSSLAAIEAEMQMYKE